MKRYNKKDLLFIVYFSIMLMSSSMYRFKNKFLLFLMSLSFLFIFGCTKDKEIVIELVEVKPEITKIVIKNMDKLDIVDTIVQDNNIVLTIDNYKKIIMNYKTLDDYNNYLLDIIKYYENNLTGKKDENNYRN